MARHLIRQGEGTAGFSRLIREHDANRRQIEQMLTQPVEATARARATAAGDASRLRGLAAIGRGCSGAIRGTRPGDNLR
jgi:hypothetical protein